ncbi:MAG: hypothetical protein H7099_05495 [Gemmatimonadaceae bacterium]|nr:hypothetical protein [Gemmatimonadaceae bacterium]
MSVLALAICAQLAVASQPVMPVLGFPDETLDDTSAYRGYQTRFYRDAARNTLQVYIDRRSARVVHLMADADNASIGFTARDAAGRTASLDWTAAAATIARHTRTRQFSHQLVAHTATVHLGWFLLGSMRVERDFQYFEKAKTSFAAAPYAIPDVDRLLVSLEALPPTVRARHLRRLNAPTMAVLRSRMYPHPTTQRVGTAWVTRVRQVTLDGRDTLTLEVRADARTVDATQSGDSLTLHARSGDVVTFDVQIGTTAKTLTPLTRQQIFTPQFLAFLDSTRARGAAVPASDTAAVRARRMERQVSGVELLVSREKLMAGLPTYATYFGRDMLMTALMMRPIWQHETLEAVIATALRKLGTGGDISHEEALGDQAVRESAAEYADLVARYRERAGAGDRPGADSLLARAETVLRDLRKVRENYHMIDDEYQFAIVVARWITDPSVPANAKRAFLQSAADGGGTRADRLLRELSLVTRLTAPYVASPETVNLIAFTPREPSGWASSSWRDSGAGYANGRYAMDINTIWVPHALESVGQILGAMRELGVPTTEATRRDSALARYVRDPATLQQAITVWRGATRHFLVTMSPEQVRAATLARLAAMPEDERAWWQSRASTPAALTDTLTFLAVALDATGAPIGVANTDPATQLFLGDAEGSSGPPTPENKAAVLRTVRLFSREYPAGLFVDRIGPVVANDAYATPAVWDAFVKDPYHGPRVVWGREANLFLLGVAGHLSRAQGAGASADTAYVAELRAALEKIRTAVEQSGFHTELWSYGFDRGQLGAMRYGSGADIQLWSTTDLAVQYVLSRTTR